MWLYVCHGCLCVTWMLMCNMDSSHMSPCVICIFVWQESLCDVTLCVSWMLVCDMNAYMWHGFFPYVSLCDLHLCVTWILVWCDSMCDMNACVWHDFWSMTLCVWHGFFPYEWSGMPPILPIWVIWLLVRDMTLCAIWILVCYDSFCDVHACVWHDDWRMTLCVRHEFVQCVWYDSGYDVTLCVTWLFFFGLVTYVHIHICVYSHMYIFFIHLLQYTHPPDTHTHTHTHTHLQQYRRISEDRHIHDIYNIYCICTYHLYIPCVHVCIYSNMCIHILYISIPQ